MPVEVVLSHAEAQSLADVERQLRKAYQPEPAQTRALAATRHAATLARRSKGDARLTLNNAEARAVLEIGKGLRNNERLSANQAAALTKIRYALQSVKV